MINKGGEGGSGGVRKWERVLLDDEVATFVLWHCSTGRVKATVSERPYTGLCRHLPAHQATVSSDRNKTQSEVAIKRSNLLLRHEWKTEKAGTLVISCQCNVILAIPKLE